jgi:hypothetical protein
MCRHMPKVTYGSYAHVKSMLQIKTGVFFKRKQTTMLVFWKSEKFQLCITTKLPNSEQSYKGKVKAHNYINRQNQSTTTTAYRLGRHPGKQGHHLLLHGTG